MKIAMMTSLLMLTGLAFAAQNAKNEKITIETFELTAPSTKMMGTDVGGTTGVVTPTLPRVDAPAPITVSSGERMEAAGKVISTAKDFVALGEAIYELVKKGKPTNTTEYAPVSVVPKDPISKEYIDPFDLEGFSMPVEKKFATVIKSGIKETVRFEYKVMYSYGGSYNGVGKWITGAQIIPISVKTSYGWDFNATMKVSGIMNHGTKADPVAGVMLIMKYSMNSWGAAQEKNDTFHITGRGEFKSYEKK